MFYSRSLFYTVVIFISIIADIYYYDHVIQKDPVSKNQICYSDFKVFWTASYHLRHYIIKFNDSSKGYATFRPFWFLDPRLRNEPINRAFPGQYKVYDKDYEFYHFRYSPFVAFLMMPFGMTFHQGHALAVWYVILNILFLLIFLLLEKRIGIDFNLSDGPRRIILWGLFLGSLRFYLTNISLGQTDILIALFFTMFLMAYVRDRQLLCGILLALILQFKLFFIPILSYLLITKKIKVVLSTILSFVFFLFLPSYMVGFDKTLELVREWFDVLGMSIPLQVLNPKNQSIVYAIGKLLLRFKWPVSPVHLFYFISAVLISSSYTIMVWFGKHASIKDHTRYKYLDLSILIMSCLIFSPVTWDAHFINIMIPLGVALIFTSHIIKKTPAYLALGAFYILSCVMGTDLTKFIPYINELHFINIALGVIFLAFALLYAYKQNLK